MLLCIHEMSQWLVDCASCVSLLIALVAQLGSKLKKNLLILEYCLQIYPFYTLDFLTHVYFCSHEHLEHPGKYEERPTAEFTGRDLEERAFTVGLGGPVGRCVCILPKSSFTFAMIVLICVSSPPH